MKIHRNSTRADGKINGQLNLQKKTKSFHVNSLLISSVYQSNTIFDVSNCFHRSFLDLGNLVLDTVALQIASFHAASFEGASSAWS